MNPTALTGRRVLVLRAQQQAAALSQRITQLGGIPVEAPVLVIEPGDMAELRAAVRDMAAGAFTLMGLTSPNGVDAVAEALGRERLDARALAGVGTIACVGPGTAARLWDRLRVVADLLPRDATTASLAHAVPPGSGRALLPRADLANPVLTEVLAEKGYTPVAITAYRTSRPERLDAQVLDDLEAGGVDIIPFASSSTVRNFASLVEDRDWHGTVVSIGPVTTRTCDELGIRVDAEADPHDLEGLVAAIVAAAR